MKKFLITSLAVASLIGTLSVGGVQANTNTIGSHNTQMVALAVQRKSGVLRTNGIAGNLSAVYSDPSGDTIVRWLPGGQDYRYDQVVNNGFTGLKYYRIATNEWIDSSNVQIIN